MDKPSELREATKKVFSNIAAWGTYTEQDLTDLYDAVIASLPEPFRGLSAREYQQTILHHLQSAKSKGAE